MGLTDSSRASSSASSSGPMIPGTRLSFRFPDDAGIKNGAQLIVRESQHGAVHLPWRVRRYLRSRASTADDRQHSGADEAEVVEYGFNSPFKADVYYLNTRLFTGNKWGTRTRS